MAENGEIEQQTQTSVPPTPIDHAENVTSNADVIGADAPDESSPKETEDETTESNVKANDETLTQEQNVQKVPDSSAGETKPSADEIPAGDEAVKSEEVKDSDFAKDTAADSEESNVTAGETKPSDDVSSAGDEAVKSEEVKDSDPAKDKAADSKETEESNVTAGDGQNQQDSTGGDDNAIGVKSEEVQKEHPKSPDIKVATPTNEGKGEKNAAPQIPIPSAGTEEMQEKTSNQQAEGAGSEAGIVEVSNTNDANQEAVKEDTENSKEGDTADVPASSSNVTQDLSAQDYLVAPVPSAMSDRQATEAGQENSVTSSEKMIPRPPTVPDTPSGVSKASAKDTMEKTEDATQPLNFEWTFGFNRRVPCLNLADDSRNVVTFVASHIAVLYDYKSNRQKLLQGHGNAITCIACSDDKRWLVTGDKGPNSCIIIWDTYTGIPVQALFDDLGQGVTSVGMSFDAKYIVTVSTGAPQVVSVWDWTTSSNSPIHQTRLDKMCQTQTIVKFHPSNNQLFLTNSEDEVFFYSWVTGKLEFDAPFLSDSTFNRAVGLFNQSLFQVEIPHRALTSTSLGNIVVWDPDRPDKKTGGVVPIHKKRPLKLVRVKDRALTALAQTDSMIVTGDAAGHVTFFDDQLNVVNSYQNFKIGPVNGVTFKYHPDFATEVSPEGKNYPEDSTIAASSFMVRDFVVSTKTSEILHIEADGTNVTRILKEHDAAIHALAASPTKPWICVGSYAGLLKLWDYDVKQVLVTRVFGHKMKIQSLAFSHNGLQLAVGMVSGAVHLIDALSFCDEVSFHYARDAITHCAFSHDSKVFATADAQYVTTVFVYHNNTEWKYLGRHKAHYAAIQDLSFGVDPDSNDPRLLTLGKDRVLVEYDLKTSAKDDLKLLSVDRIEQSAIPLCLAWYPPVAKESFILTGNDQYKMKLYNTTTKMCRKTLLGPTYGSPVRLITVVPTLPNVDPSINRMLCYATENKVGLQLLPLDGNPHRSASSIAHPGGVSRLACSNDGKYVFTAGGREADVHMWSVNRKALEAVAALGGEDLTPFYGLLDGGRQGEMFSELENYFYYAQLRSQGINTTEEREVSRVVPLEQVPFIMRALGFYPSEQEIEDLLNEVKFSQYVETGQYVTEIDLADLIKLYVNHRPAFGLSPDELRNAFEVLRADYCEGDEPSVGRDSLLSTLQRKGEHMTEYELAECLTTLLGFCPEGGSVELGEAPDHDEASQSLEEVLPQTVTPSMFANEILGLNLYE